MNNLTSTILANHSNIQAEERTKQGQAIEFNSGKNQRVIGSSIPALEMTLTYKNITLVNFELLRGLYEANHANTFIVDADDINDLRPDVMGLNSSVWAFKEFKFRATADTLFNGTITLVSSVFFNYTQYTAALTQSSTYSPVTSTNTDFDTLLDSAQPYQVEYDYVSNSIFSNIGQSVRHIKDKGGLRRKWKLSWLLNESQFLLVQKFYRQKAGIMGSFGIPDRGYKPHQYNTVELFDEMTTYIEDYTDYFADDYLENEGEFMLVLSGTGVEVDDGLFSKTNAIFVDDAFKFTKRVDNMYVCSADIVESLNV